MQGVENLFSMDSLSLPTKKTVKKHTLRWTMFSLMTEEYTLTSVSLLPNTSGEGREGESLSKRMKKLRRPETGLPLTEVIVKNLLINEVEIQLIQEIIEGAEVEIGQDMTETGITGRNMKIDTEKSIERGTQEEGPGLVTEKNIIETRKDTLQTQVIGEEGVAREFITKNIQCLYFLSFKFLISCINFSHLKVRISIASSTMDTGLRAPVDSTVKRK